MKYEIALTLLASLVLTGCYERPSYICEDTCPPIEDIQEARSKIAEVWKPYIEDPVTVMETYQILWRDEQLIYRGTPIYGATIHHRNRVAIWYNYPCDFTKHVKGLCPGVFDWEMGLVLTEHLFPGSSESEKIAWRVERGLLNELDIP